MFRRCSSKTVRPNFLSGFLVAVALVGCGGSGGSEASVDAGPEPTTAVSAQKVVWSGRAWFHREGALYAQHYADEKAIPIDKNLNLGSGSRPQPAFRVTRDGQLYLLYVGDFESTRTDFAVRRSTDGTDSARFRAPYYTERAEISDDGRYIAWVWGDDYYNSIILHQLTLSLIDLQADGSPKVVADLLPSSGANERAIAGVEWAPDGHLIYTRMNGEVWRFSTETYQQDKIGTLPVHFGEFTINPKSIRVSPQGNRILGGMQIGDDRSEVWVANIDGSGLRQHTAVGLAVTNFAWSPDGQSIHGGDCRVAIGSHPDVNTGAHSWIAPANKDKLTSLEASNLAADYLKWTVEVGFLPCDFVWTE